MKNIIISISCIIVSGAFAAPGRASAAAPDLSSAFDLEQEDPIIVSGPDVKAALGGVIPNLDEYLQMVVDRIDGISVTHGRGKLIFDVDFTDDRVRLDLLERRKARTGRLYAVELDRHLHAEVNMFRSRVTIDHVSGLKALIKLPLVPDGVAPLAVTLDAATERLTVTAAALDGLLVVVGKANVRTRKFAGLDWLATLLDNLPRRYEVAFVSSPSTVAPASP